MNTDGRELALVPLTDRIEADELLLVYETMAAKMLKISINDVRRQIPTIYSGLQAL